MGRISDLGVEAFLWKAPLRGFYYVGFRVSTESLWGHWTAVWGICWYLGENFF